MNCERHPEREGQLAISLPSIGIARYWCQECRDEYDRTHPVQPQSPHWLDPTTPAWERAALTGERDAANSF
jgi:hypothetical protein